MQGSIKLLKLDAYDHQKPLQGAVFNLYQLNVYARRYELIIEGLQTDPYGQLIISGLDIGKYKIVEVAAPKGYLKGVEEFLAEIQTDHLHMLNEPDWITTYNSPDPAYSCNDCCNSCNCYVNGHCCCNSCACYHYCWYYAYPHCWQ